MGAANVDYELISHKELKSAVAASKSLKLPLQLGLVADQSGISDALKAASDPTSFSYGTYLSLSKLASKCGASSSKRKAALVAPGAFAESAKRIVPDVAAFADESSLRDRMLPCRGLPRSGFVPPLLYALAKQHREAFFDIAQGGNALFGGSCCPARPRYDLATGCGSPLANTVAAFLGSRGRRVR